jgi:hypothetical protein
MTPRSPARTYSLARSRWPEWPENPPLKRVPENLYRTIFSDSFQSAVPCGHFRLYGIRLGSRCRRIAHRWSFYLRIIFMQSVLYISRWITREPQKGHKKVWPKVCTVWLHLWTSTPLATVTYQTLFSKLISKKRKKLRRLHSLGARF